MRKLTLLECLGVLSLGMWGAAALASRLAARRSRWLDDIPGAGDSESPLLSIIVPACNEADTVIPAMESLLALDYPELEIVAVDDRSTDSTGEILDRFASGDSRLRVIHVRSLPPGWLGKNHALWQGASASRGEFVLFTDADVLFRRDALRRAIRLAMERNADHLVVAPGIILEGFWERLLVSYFGMMFNLHCRTWDVDNPKSRAHVGIGAFNMVRRTAYDAVGGHTALPMEVADDLKLGKVLKFAGFRQIYALGGDPVKVRWVVGLEGFVTGLTKNFFAGLEYRWITLLEVTILLGATHVLPAYGVMTGSRFSRLCFAGAFAGMVIAATPPGLRQRLRGTSDRQDVLPSQQGLQDLWERTRLAPWPLYGLAYPLASVIWLYAAWRSAIITETRGGIEWRGTFYPLDELRRGVV